MSSLRQYSSWAWWWKIRDNKDLQTKKTEINRAN